MQNFLPIFNRLFKRFGSDSKGAVAILFGLLLVPLLAGAGIAVDYARAASAKSRMLNALDSAALAVAATQETDPVKLKTMASTFFQANYAANQKTAPGQFTLTILDEKITISASMKIKTKLVKIIGITELDVGASVEVVRGFKGLEVVMVLDNTGSMGSNNKIGALRDAASELVRVLSAEQPDPTKLKIGLVPFSAAVNVGTQYRNSGWIDVNALNPLHGWQFQNNENIFTMYDRLSNKSWNGCVEARPSPHDVSDTVPTNLDGNTLFVPYFAPDEPDDKAAEANGYRDYPNNYLDDELKKKVKDLTIRQENPLKYNNDTVFGQGPHYNCRNAPVAALTSNISNILTAINNMTADGYTLIPLGLAWGWRLLSPEAPFTEGTPYGDDKMDKAIVLLTDGLNNIGSYSNHNRSRFNGYGYVAQGRLGTTSASTAQAMLDTKTTELCNKIKAKGIIIYTITFQLNHTATQNLFRNCATDPNKYFNSPSNAELKTSFKAIAKDLSKLRLSK